MKTLFILFITHLFLVNCHKNTSDTKTTNDSKIAIVWQNKIIADNSVIDGYGNTAVSDDEVVFFSSETQANYLKFYNKKTGQLIATWNDWIEPNQQLQNIGFSPIFYKNFVLINDVYGSYIIDKNSKHTIKKIAFLHALEDKISTFEDKYFFTVYPETATEGQGGNGSLIMVDLNTYEKTELINTNRTPNVQFCYIDDNKFYFSKDKNGNRFIHFTYSDLTDFDVQTGIGSYRYYKIINIDTKQIEKSSEIIYNSQKLKYGGNGEIDYFNGKLYFGGSACIDTLTKKILWEMPITNFTFDKENSIIYASIQNIEPPLGFFLKAIDANTGVVLWQTNIGNHCTKPLVMNGVVYTTVNSLLAFDARTGADIFRVSASSLNPDDKSDFDSHNVVGDGENIYLSSGMYAYCIKGVK